MQPPRISASSYSNTAPLVWSFLYGTNHGKVEIILDNAPARSAELLMQDRVDAALVPVIASQFIDGVRIVPGVCVGAKERVRSVCLVTRGKELADVRSVSLDVSSRTSVVLTKIIFREFLGFEPDWRDASPNVDAMLAESDAALIIGDPALVLSVPPASAGGYLSEPGAIATGSLSQPEAIATGVPLRAFDLANLWRDHTGLGFIFAMWMTRRERGDIDFAAARDEGLRHIDEIIANYESQIPLTRDELAEYLATNISYQPDQSMLDGLNLYLDLAAKHKLIERHVPLTALGSDLAG